MGPCPHARPCVGWRVCVRQNVPLEKILPHPMQTLRRNRCQTRTRPRKKACVYGVRVSGATIFAYVNAKPLVKVDPEGLVDWSGIVVTGGIVNIAGGVVVYFDLTSECVCNKRVRIKGYATFLAAGLGAKFTGSGGSSTFYDHNACPNENAANGLAAGAAISLVTVGGASISATALGSLRSTWPPISTGLLGFDVSAVVMLGASWGRGSTEQCCSK